MAQVVIDVASKKFLGPDVTVLFLGMNTISDTAKKLVALPKQSIPAEPIKLTKTCTAEEDRCTPRADALQWKLCRLEPTPSNGSFVMEIEARIAKYKADLPSLKRDLQAHKDLKADVRLCVAHSPSPSLPSRKHVCSTLACAA